MKEISRRTVYHEPPECSWMGIIAVDAEIVVEDDKLYYLHGECTSDPGWDEIAYEITTESVVDYQIKLNDLEDQGWDSDIFDELIAARDKIQRISLTKKEEKRFGDWKEELRKMLYDELINQGLDPNEDDEDDEEEEEDE